jgi:dolichol-phosphate mannosyltransferase
MPDDLVCTVLPTYNEHANIGPLVERLLAANDPPYLVLVVDDNSPDGTWQVVERLADLHPYPPPAGARQGSVMLIRRIHESGLTSAIQRGIDEAINTYDASIVTWMDCDLSMPPEDVPRLVAAIREGGADVAIGSRWIPGGTDMAHDAMPRTLSWIINRFAMLLLGDEVHDYTSGFIAGRAEVLRQVRLRGDYGEYCIDLLARASRLDFELQEVPYVCVPRTAGDSKTGAHLGDYLAKGRKYVAAIVSLRLHSQA